MGCFLATLFLNTQGLKGHDIKKLPHYLYLCGTIRFKP